MNLDALLRIKADVQGENNIRRLGNSMQGLQGQVKNAQMSFSGLQASVRGFAAAITGSAVVGGLSAIVKKSAEAGEALFNLQQITGISAKALTGITNEAKLANVDIEVLGKAINKFNVNLAAAANGNEDMAQKFKDLGINIRDAKGNLAPTDEVLKKLADRFADMPDGAQKAAAAVALFGKSGAALIPMLNDGAAAMEKLTYKVSDDFAARSDLFNDTLTTLGIKTQGFGMELTDALLPALQSILEEFSKLFDSKNDWTALFETIKFGLRAVATVIYATIKLVDQLTKTVVYTFDAIGKAFRGDFEGAGRAVSQGFGAGIEQAKQDFAAIGRMWNDSAAPDRRTARTPLNVTNMDDVRKQREESDRAAKKAADDYNRALKESVKLADELSKQTRDVSLETQNLGAVGVDAIGNKYQAALNDIEDEQKKVFKQIQDLVDLTGGKLKFEGLQTKAKALLNAMSAKASAEQDQALKEQAAKDATFMNQLRISSGTLGSDEERRLRIAERLAQIQKDMPDLYKKQGDEIRRLVTESEGLTEAQQRNKEVVQGIAENIGGALKSSFDLIINGTKDWANSLREIGANLLKSIADQLMQIMVIKPIVNAISSIKFAGGGIMTPQGELPLRKYAGGGIATSPQLAMFGEGSMNEAYVPLPDGRRIPVAMKGAGGGTNVTVNVDAKGSSVQGDSGRGDQLGKVIAGAVQAELVRQKRPGGLLAA